MIGKIIGAFVGDKLAKQTGAMGGAGGAALGVVASTVLRRMSLPAMIALGVGGYVAKKALDGKQGGTSNGSKPENQRVPRRKAKAA